MTHATVKPQHVETAKRAKTIIEDRPKFGAPVSRQQVADFVANAPKGQRSKLTKAATDLERLVSGEIGTKELDDKVKAALKACSGPEVYAKGWPIKTALIVLALRK